LTPRAGLRISRVRRRRGWCSSGVLVTGGFAVGGEITLGITKEKVTLKDVLSPSKGFSIPNADTIYDLNGFSKSFSGGLVIANVSVGDDGNPSLSVLPGSLDIGCSYNWVWGYVIPISNYLKWLAENNYAAYDQVGSKSDSPYFQGVSTVSIGQHGTVSS
jgi:hypothetical protein